MQRYKEPGESMGSYHARYEKNRAFLPDPEVLENYNYVVEGSAERIISLIEREQEHRQRYEYRALFVYAVGYYLGIVCTLLAIASVVAGAAFLGWNGQFGLALAVTLAGLASITSMYIINARLKTPREKSLAQQQRKPNAGSSPREDATEARSVPSTPRPPSATPHGGANRNPRRNNRR